MYLDDTIAAISTAPGEGGIGIVRISGKDAKKILKSIFNSARNKDVQEIKSYTMMYGYIVNPKNNEVIDEVIVSYMKEPNTYTREDIVEINCHGGMVAVRKILSIVIENGARLAEAGEFTKRAFLNGRIDLSQAEAVIDLIRAKTDDSMSIALEQSRGKLSERVKENIEGLLDILAHIEATVDFSEEDIDEVVNNNIINKASNIEEKILKLIENADKGKILREGLNTIIIGKPNTGKSSLLNALLQEKRAIVTDIPGTTRDIIEEYININGIPVKLVDTAGIREAHDLVEKIGVERTRDYIKKADLIIFMVDGSRKIDDEDIKIIDLIGDKKAVVVVNKSDLPLEADIDVVKEKLKDSPFIYASVKTENGVEDVKNSISSFVYRGDVSIKDLYVTNIRHKKALSDAAEAIQRGIETIKMGYPIDMASIEFKDAYLKLGEITGDTVTEDIIDRIFSSFCIGK